LEPSTRENDRYPDTKIERARKIICLTTPNKNTINTAIIPGLAYAFPVVPCSPNLLNRWNQKIGQTFKTEFKLDNNPSKAMMREQQHRFGMGCPSITGEYHAQCTEALLSSLNNSSL